MKIPFYKCNGNGNSFIIIEHSNEFDRSIFTTSFIQKICRKNKNKIIDGFILLNHKHDDIYMDSFDSLLKNIDKLLDNDVNYFGNKLNFTHEKTDEERNILIPQWHFRNVTPDLHIPYRGKYPYSWAGGETYGLDMRTSKFISGFSDQDILNDSAFTRPFEDMSVALLAERANNLKRGILDDVSIRCQMSAEEILNAIK